MLANLHKATSSSSTPKKKYRVDEPTSPPKSIFLQAQKLHGETSRLRLQSLNTPQQSENDLRRSLFPESSISSCESNGSSLYYPEQLCLSSDNSQNQSNSSSGSCKPQA